MRPFQNVVSKVVIAIDVAIVRDQWVYIHIRYSIGRGRREMGGGELYRALLKFEATYLI
jgi:hypothetical protein